MDFEDTEEFQNSDEESFDEVEEESRCSNLPADYLNAQKNYDMAGQEVPEEQDQISIADHHHLLNDVVHQYLQEVLHEVQLPYSLSDFQLLSLHVLGSGKSLMLLSPTGSGKTNVIYLGILLMRKIFNIPDGVVIVTEPLNMIMAEKLKSSLVPTGVISMTGELKTSLEETDGVKLSAPEESFLDGSLPCLFGHPEAWLSVKGRKIVKDLYKKNMILMLVTDEMTCSLNWSSIRYVT